MADPTLGIQLYTLMRHIQTAEAFDDTLGKLEKMGVCDVQISGINEDIPIETQKEILCKHNMKVCITHKDFDRMKNDLPTLVAEHRIIGCDAIGLGYGPNEFHQPFSAASDLVKQLDEIACNMKAFDISFHYHNHSFEFDKLEGSDKTLMELMLESQQIKFVPDVAWMQIAGADPVEMLYRMKGRVKVVHFKDYDFDKNGERRFVSLGTGKVDLKACYEAAAKLEIPYIVYEQDSGWINDDAFLATQQSWDFMQSLQ